MDDKWAKMVGQAWERTRPISIAPFHILCILSTEGECSVVLQIRNLMWLGDEFLQNALWLAHKNAVESSLKKEFSNQFFGDKSAFCHQK
jgi:hypothetical protein